MFILYTVAPLLYRLASSAYFNLSLLSSDFYGLLFGTHLISNILPISFPDLRHRTFPFRTLSPLHYCDFLTRSRLALSTILALFPFIHRGFIGAYRLLLAFHAYVLCHAFAPPSDDICS